MRNPQAFQQYEQIRKSNGNPKEMLNEIIGKYTPEQKEQFSNFIKGYGITDEQLKEYGINTTK